MSLRIIDQPVSAVLLDIEGTTTPITFVYDVLFPYAHNRARNFLESHLTSQDVIADINELRAERSLDDQKGFDPPSILDNSSEELVESVTRYIHWLMEKDRKSTPLKSLQGKIWEEGYKTGSLLSQLFDDVPRAFQNWHESDVEICIYSSGSVLAQKLLFAHTEAGDLTGFIKNYFDTNVGAKIEKESYLRIADALSRPLSEVAFFSDVTAELGAARSAGMQSVLCMRPGNRPQPDSSAYPSVRSFDELFK
jgi:enolase-phosphatase E1